MEIIYIWEKIMYVAAAVSIVGPIMVGIFAFKWIGKTYFPKGEK